MSGALRRQGQGNGQGFAVGPAYAPLKPERLFNRSEASLWEWEQLEQAIDTATAELEDLMQRSDPDSAEILEFQVEMLHDPSLLERAAEFVFGGLSAAQGWDLVLDMQIGDFEESEIDEIRARAIDVIDVRDRVLAALCGPQLGDFPAGAIFVAKDMPPSVFLAHDWTAGGGIVLEAGSTASHVALLARARGVPMVVGVGTLGVNTQTPLLVNSESGLLIVEPTAEELAVAATDGAAPHEAEKADLVEPGFSDMQSVSAIRVLVNINALSDIRHLDPGTCDGVGLVRTEFLFSSPADLGNEELQVERYCEILRWAAGRPVTIRLLDLGGDKPQAGLETGERNPFLGLRGIRLLLARPDILHVQARALLRAGASGSLNVLLPMVTLPEEVDATRRVFDVAADGLVREGVPAVMPAIGMMIEVPAAALMLDLFKPADFFSLGTNDLAQYLMAASRDNPSVAGLHEKAGPVLLRLIGQCVATAGRMGKPIGICGDMAGDLVVLPSLMACGIRQVSVAPFQLAAIRAMQSRVGMDG